MECIPYEERYAADWDRFVMDESMNGTFLQTRRFLGYHPPERFQDASFFVVNEKGTFVAAVPAALCERDGRRVLCSHPGSTYGGPVIRENCNTTDKLFSIFELLDAYFSEHCDVCELKPTPQLYAAQSNALLLYVLQQYGFSAQAKLNTCVTGLAEKSEDMLFSAVDYSKRRNIKKGIQRALTFEPLTTDEEIAQFHRLLTLNLSKFGAVPVHSLADLLVFRHERLQKEALFYGVRNGNTMVAACLLFYFQQTKLLHTQNLSVDISLEEYNPAAFLYYHALFQAKRLGCNALSWGTSAEENAMGLNLGLIQSKEAFGSTYDLNYRFTKAYSKKA